MQEYKLKFKDKALKEFKRLNRSTQAIIVKKLNSLKNGIDKNNNIKKLQGYDTFYRLRIGDYRIILDKQDKVLVIEIIRIAHRKDVYKNI